MGLVYSCCTNMEHYSEITLAGYDRIILSAYELTKMEESAFQKTIDTLKNGRIQCRALNDFCGSDLKLCGPGFQISAVREYSRKLMKRSSLLGVEYIGIGAPKSRNIPEDYPRDEALTELKESLGVICEEAAAFGIVILLEAVCTLECNFITNTNEAFDIVDSMALDNLHLVFDTYHAFMMGEDEGPLRKAMNEVKLIHVAQEIGQRRHFPQDGFLEGHRSYFNTFLNSGFHGEIGIEASLTNLNGELKEALDILKMLCRETA